MSSTQQPPPSRLSRAIVGLTLLGGVAAAAHALRSALILPERLESIGMPRTLLTGWLALAIVFQLAAGYRVLRGRAGGVRTLRRGFCLVCSAWLAALIWLQPIDQLVTEIVLGSVAGVFGLAVALARPRGRMPRGVRGFELVAFNLCATAVFLEMALAAAAWLNPTPVLMVGSESMHRRMTALARPAEEPHMGFPTNSLGHYDVEFLPRAERQETTVAMIGDSFSASYVPHRYHFTTVAEQALNDVEIYNFGIPGIGPQEYLYLLQTQVVPIDPDAVVISIFAGNDIGSVQPSSVADEWLWPWFDRGQVRLFSVPHHLMLFAAERARGGAVSPADAIHGKQLLSSEAELIEAYPWLHDYRLESGTFSEVAYLDLVRDRILDACKPSSARMATFFGYIDQMRQSAGERPLGIVLLPAEFQVEDELWRRAVEGLDESGLDRDEPQKSIRAGLDQRGIPYVDLLPVVRAEPARADGDRHCYLLRDTHFNVRGNEIVGRTIAPFVRQLVATSGR